MKPLALSRPPWWRVVLLAAFAAVLCTTVLAPWLMPLLAPAASRDAETASLLGLLRFEIATALEETRGYFEAQRHWPAAARDIGRVDDNGVLAIDMPEALRIRFRHGNGFEPESGLRGTALIYQFDPASNRWRCTPGQPSPPTRWLAADCRAEMPESAAWTAWAAFGAALAVLLVAVGLLAFDPRVRALQAAPARLRRTAVDDLLPLDRRLRALLRREAALSAASIDAADWRVALRWSGASPEARAQALATRVGATQRRLPPWPDGIAVFEWRLPAEMPLAVDRLLLCVPDASSLTPRELLGRLQAQGTGQDVLLVLSPAPSFDVPLLAWAGDGSHLGAVAVRAAIGEWLLHARPMQVLVALLAAQLTVTRISPYQTRGGVTRPSAFFGRTQLLASILGREPGNYLLVGGRQLGKTSLMKAIERRFEGHPRVRCHYLSLRDHRLAPRLTQLAELEPEAPAERAIERLRAQAGGRRLLLLVDECDLFLRAEARSGYAELGALRAQSEEDRCHFMLAGFWDLYESAILDFASPIRNFGEVVRLGPLEREACVELAAEPMQRLGLAFEQPALVDRLVDACGRRANLVAIVCQQLIERLPRGERRFDAASVDAALASEAVQDALAGWSRLSPEPRACALDRALVYRVALRELCGEGPLDLASWFAELESAGITAAAEAVRQSVARLELAYVVQRVDAAGDAPGGLRFAVPLQTSQFTRDEAYALLARELRDLGAPRD